MEHTNKFERNKVEPLAAIAVWCLFKHVNKYKFDFPGYCDRRRQQIKHFNFWKSGLKTGRKLRPKSTLNYILKTKINVCYDFDPMKDMLVDFSFDNLNSNRSTEWTWAIFSSLRVLIYEVMIGYAWTSLIKNKSGMNKIPLLFICEGDESTENM